MDSNELVGMDWLKDNNVLNVNLSSNAFMVEVSDNTAG